ncbi:hypothetical protein KH172YL63_40060 [Bacillus sp. KH172YL63]|nr:hypothetical protein KH172YL63_40060 [Bacillus sp. KH172YL63]
MPTNINFKKNKKIMKTLYCWLDTNWIPNEKTFGECVFSLGIYYVVHKKPSKHIQGGYQIEKSKKSDYSSSRVRNEIFACNEGYA